MRICQYFYLTKTKTHYKDANHSFDKQNYFMKNTSRQKKQELIELVSDFCQEKLNDEYKTLCVELVKKLGRKINVPFISGKLDINKWLKKPDAEGKISLFIRIDECEENWFVMCP